LDLYFVAERDHRRFSGIRRQQLRKQNAAAAQFIDHAPEFALVSTATTKSIG
jgi:hypothetical protein